ncbi:hypothetical protein [Methanotorris formicicus]|uniref:Uncharacterized protein n=1 Tax=Methanotorris formicicus Mc-S-70 TaxID=647171 RepID=H1L1P3_9EURY|nr:hypothetical protein [Methanotorris formicicus]EHP83583.1 hypothetical protein MetfoDRAFT_1967 [Methanotorris formicicus Mc-S-70]
MKEIFGVKEVKHDFIKSIVLFIILILIPIIFKIDVDTLKLAEKMHNSFLTISITFAGFLLTALAILVTFPTNEKIEFMKKHKLYPKIFQVYILQYLRICIRYAQLSIIYWFICIYVHSN